MSVHPLNAALKSFRRKKTAKPEGAYSVEDAAKRWGMSVDNARRTLSEMSHAGIVTEIKGSKINGAGIIQPCVYYKTKGS